MITGAETDEIWDEWEDTDVESRYTPVHFMLSELGMSATGKLQNLQYSLGSRVRISYPQRYELQCLL